jgi:hypothetical protein
MPYSKLATLFTLLETASALLEELEGVSDRQLARLAGVFTRMPAEDREPILAILEREVELRLLARERGATVSGFDIVRPNPNARLYIRVFGRQPVYHSRDELMRATLRAARMMLHTPERMHDDWEAATLEAFRALTPAERAAIKSHNQEMLSLLERFEGETKAKAG